VSEVAGCLRAGGRRHPVGRSQRREEESPANSSIGIRGGQDCSAGVAGIVDGSQDGGRGGGRKEEDGYGGREEEEIEEENACAAVPSDARSSITGVSLQWVCLAVDERTV